MSFVVWNTVQGYKPFESFDAAKRACDDTNSRMVFSSDHAQTFIRKGSSDVWHQVASTGHVIGTPQKWRHDDKRLCDDRRSSDRASKHQREAIDPSVATVDRIGVKQCHHARQNVAFARLCLST